MKKIFILVFTALTLLILILSSPAYSAYGPQAHLTETITASYTTTGLDGASGTPATLARTGYIEVSVPNTDDVLQHIRLNLSSNTETNTNIEKWNGDLTAYRDYALSNPTLQDRTRMYINTTQGNKQPAYTPAYNWAPPINLSMTVINTQAGNDLYSTNNTETSINTMFFNFTIRNDAQAGNKNYAGTNVTVTIRFNKTSSTQSSASIDHTTLQYTAGTATPSSSGGGADNDTILWQGPLDAAQEVYLTFNATCESTTNYMGHTNNLNGETSEVGTRAEYTNNTHVISEITFTQKLARGPVREGVDLMKGTPWRAKTFIRNMANASVATSEHNLTYNITSWRVYNVTGTTGEISSLLDSNDNLNHILGISQQYTIPGFVETTDTKPYIAPYFDWHVLWNDTDPYIYSGTVNITMQLPTLYEIDLIPTKETPDEFTPSVINTKLLSYNVTAMHNGATSSEVESGKIQIYSSIPYTDTTNSGYANLTIGETTYKVYYINASGTYELDTTDPDLSLTITQSTQTSNGSIVLNIYDLSKVDLSGGGELGLNLTPTDRIILSYDIWAYENSTGSGVSGLDDGEWYHFDGNQTLWTQSGTYITVQNSDLRLASQNSLGAWKQLISYDPASPELVNVTISLTVTGTINNIKFADYVPTGITNTTPVTLTFDGSPWSEDIDYNRTNLGTTLTSDGLNVTIWEYTNVTPGGDGWNFTNNNLLLTYLMNISSAGVYVLPVQIAAFDPGVNQGISLTRYGAIRIIVPEKQLPLVINEDEELTLAKTIFIGKPPVFRKSVTIYNPNSRPTKSQFRTEIFKDTISTYVTYYNLYGESLKESPLVDIVDNCMYVYWETTLNPHESRTYEIRVLTPPVIEVDRDVNVLEKLENKHVKLEAEIVLKNFAEEKYSNVRMIVPILSKNIYSIKDSLGSPLDYIGDSGATTIPLPAFDKNSIQAIKITYKESYPTIIITPDRTRYDSGQVSGLEILVINGGEKIEDPYFEAEIYTEQLDMIYADILKLGKSLDPLEKTTLFTKWKIPLNAPTGKYIANVRFREDFATISESSINFYVLGNRSSDRNNITLILLILAGAAIIYILYKRHTKK
ncbi:MAG: hypothetical protein DRN71_04345 [Candidatus Nanohalarchaeota archaeon]|nr:MAG: hypothetical protein DRN71_04345 [Candidatus Nanohaloarchaeota archaeon]